MTNIELLECAQSVYDFLIDGTDNIYPLQIKSMFTEIKTETNMVVQYLLIKALQ
jgi:hypothetical protein